MAKHLPSYRWLAVGTLLILILPLTMPGLPRAWAVDPPRGDGPAAWQFAGLTADPNLITRISVASDGTQANSGAYQPAISADGRFVAFESGASNLVPGDTNNRWDIFVHDRDTGQTSRISVASGGTQANNDSFAPAISDDGRLVAFQSQATNLVPGDTNNTTDIFIHDRQTGQTSRVSVASDGAQANDWSYRPALSADGRCVAFASPATNLVPGDTNGKEDVFVHDRQTGQTSRVSVASGGVQGNDGNGGEYRPAISADGRLVTFVSLATNLVPGDTNNTSDVFVHDRDTGQTSRVSVASDGTQGNGSGDYSAYDAAISATGRFVAFDSAASNLVAGDTNYRFDVFVHDRQTGQTSRVSVASNGAQGEGGPAWHPAISADGRFVAFRSGASNLVAGDTNGSFDIFVHDRDTGLTSRVSVASDGAQANNGSDHPAISADGRFVAFESAATSLVPGDTNGSSDVFVAWREALFPPAAPTLQPIDNPDGDGQYPIAWNSVNGAQTYILQEDNDAAFGSPITRYEGTGLQYLVTGQPVGRWYYRARAINAAGLGPWSNVQPADVRPAAPALQPIPNADCDGSYEVCWQYVAGATGYTLQEDDQPGFASPADLYTGPNLCFQVAGHTGGVWYYRVQAASGAGDSPWSGHQPVHVAPAAPLLNPIDNADGDDEYLVDWNDVGGAAAYVLHEDDNPGLTSPAERYSGPDSQHPVSDQPAGTWYYRVQGSTGVCPGAWSNAQSVTVQASAVGDAYEDDDACTGATTIATNGTRQSHTFHDEGDEDWIQFQAQASKTYVLRIDNLGDRADAVLALYDRCEGAPLSSGHNAFGPTVTLEWDAPTASTYYLALLQNDPSQYGEGTGYQVSVTVDTTPPSAPRSLHASAEDRKLIVQWQRSPERDVTGYRISWDTQSGPPYGAVASVDGAANTFCEIGDLDNGTLYYISLQTLDFSGNASDYSPQIAKRPAPSADTSRPELSITQPSTRAVYSTTMTLLSVGGTASDSGRNLSRVHVRNMANGSEGWDYGLSGESAAFTVGGIALADGENPIQVTAFDSADNSGAAALTVRRLSGLNGVVVIVGGRNSSGSLQANINYVTDRAYRVFKAAGIPPADIYYLSPGPRDADGDGMSDVRATTTPANLHAALQWAAGRLSPGAPFYLYLMDHGEVEVFCAEGCSGGREIGSRELDSWMNELEASSGCDQVNVVIDACHSGSFLDKFGDPQDSISRDGRVVMASTGRNNNAYGSAQGAYFSDAFFSAVADSRDLLASFEHARAAVGAAHDNQTPWLDDNGDGVYNPADGAHARHRYVARFFGAVLPQILSASVQLDGQTGQIDAAITPGAEPLRSVWAAVYGPSFRPPDETTLDLGVPLVELVPDPEQSGHYTAQYNGFLEQGAYRLVIYAEDAAGNQAQPRVLVAGGPRAYLPLAWR